MRPPTSEASSGGDDDEVEDVVDYEPGLLLRIFHFYSSYPIISLFYCYSSKIKGYNFSEAI